MVKRIAKLAVVFVAVSGALAYAGDDPVANPHDPDAGRLVAAAAQRPQRVNICHQIGTGDFNLLTISDRAVAGHLRHGDIYPVPLEGCPGGVCADFSGPTPAGAGVFWTVTWGDDVNTTAGYTVEASINQVDWVQFPAVVGTQSGSPEVYSKDIVISPLWFFFDVYVRVVASCGEVSSVVLLQ